MALQQVARVGLPARLRANFGVSLGAAPTSAAGECAGASLAVRFAPRSPASLTLRRSSLGTRSESGGDADGIEDDDGRARGLDGKQRRRARPYDKAHQARDRIQPGAGISRLPDRGRSGTSRERQLPASNPAFRPTRANCRIGWKCVLPDLPGW